MAAGDPQDPGTLCGPLISDKQRTRVRGYIQKGIDEGAKLLVGGTDDPAGRDKGFWVTPTMFVDVDNAMTIAQEEIFGPVLTVIPFENEEDAIRIANDSVYGWPGTSCRVRWNTPWPSPVGCVPGSSVSTAAPATAPMCRSAATRPAASAARTATPASINTPSSNPSPYPVA
jgi:hypothetical protein